MSISFGPAGNSDSFSKVHRSSLAAPEWIAGLGLDAYEYQCGKGVNVGQETARKLGANARAAGVRLSLHAPYFINLANPDPESLEKTTGYILAACRAADWMGAGRVVIHSGALMKRTRRQALDIALHALEAVVAACDAAGYGHIVLCPETMGKINQLGDPGRGAGAVSGGRAAPAHGGFWPSSLRPQPGADEGEEATERTPDKLSAARERSGPAASTAIFPAFSLRPAGARRCTSPLTRTNSVPPPPPDEIPGPPGMEPHHHL